jgi:hypothetical protein
MTVTGKAVGYCAVDNAQFIAVIVSVGTESSTRAEMCVGRHR